MAGKKRKQKPWSEQARKNHAEGVRRYQSYRQDKRIIGNMLAWAREDKIDLDEMVASLLAIIYGRENKCTGDLKSLLNKVAATVQ